MKISTVKLGYNELFGTMEVCSLYPSHKNTMMTYIVNLRLGPKIELSYVRYSRDFVIPVISL
jgi:hypothetical protein